MHKIAGLPGDWTMAHFRSAEVAKIRAQVGKARVICGLSGGVNSAVASVLIHEAIGDQLTCIFVDHGLLRAERGRGGRALFRGAYNIPLVARGRERAFLAALAGVTTRRRSARPSARLFIDVFEEEAEGRRRPGIRVEQHSNFWRRARSTRM